MIDERKLIEAFEKSFEPNYNEFGDYECLARMNLKGILSVISKQPRVGEWIPCSERLPERTGNYIVTTKTTNQFNEIYYEVIESTYWAHSKKWEDTVDDISICVIAWMPFPDPYKGGKE